MHQPTHFPSSTEFPKQFLVSRERRSLQPGWQELRLGDYHLQFSPGVGVTRIQESGTVAQRETLVLGWFGYRDVFYPAPGHPELMIEGLAEDIYPEMTGRFVILTLDRQRLLCTADAGGQFPVVYRKETGELGSSPMVLGWTAALQKAPQTVEAFSRADGTRWFPFGMTPYAGVERLLPQHTVVLDNHGANEVLRRRFKTTLLNVPQMHGMATDFIRSLCSSEGTVECHLTAGWDSRMVLSASLLMKDKLNYLTYLADGDTARIDAEVANHIASLWDLNHHRVPVERPSASEVDSWLMRTSECVFDSVTGLTRTIVDTYADRFGLAGVGGEVGRAFYWKKRDIDAKGLSPEELLDRLGFGGTPLALQGADRWLEDYRGESRSRILDRAYIDIRLGCWAGPALGGHLVQKPTLSPFNSMAMYESMLALPEADRLTNEFARDFIAQGSAALARVPVNRLLGARRLGNLHREVARMLPKGMKSEIRRLLSSRVHA